jgi:hypothetical protein
MASRSAITIDCSAAVLAVLIVLGLMTTSAAAQTWEYSPYDIRLWVAVENLPETSGLAEEIGHDVAVGARLASGVVWRIFPEPAPQTARVDLLTRLDVLAPDQLATQDPDPFQIEPARFSRYHVAASGDGERLRADKLVIVAVRAGDSGYQVEVRELDVATRQWSELYTASTTQLQAIPALALTNVVRAIRPIAKVERVQGRSVLARLRASGLIATPDSPAAVTAGQVMTPVIRRNARNGEPAPNGIYAPAWSYVAVDAREETTVLGTISSGYGSVIPAKGSPRTERLLLGLKPHYTRTRLELRARVAATPGKGPPPPGRLLAGYEVYVKNIGEEKTELLGLTDWNGGIELQPGANLLRLFYIKNGGQLVARLPLVVGHKEQITANVLDDDPRLAAESYVKSLQSRVTDLVARRQILEVRIRNKIKKGDFAAAHKLVADFRNLPTGAQLTRELEDTQRRMSNVSGVTGKRIEKLFLDAHKLLQGFLDPATADKLALEVAEAEKKGPPPAASTPAPAPVPVPTVAPTTPAT